MNVIIMKYSISSLIATLLPLLLISCSCDNRLNPDPDPEPLVTDTVLFRSSADSIYRIPAFTVTNDGTIIALGDLRYDHGKDVGSAEPLDIMVRRSSDNGKTWSASSALIKNADYEGIYGFGDAAMVADRESGEVLILCVGDREGITYGNGGRLEVHRFASTDGGKTFPEHTDLSDQFYGQCNRWRALFVASGKIFQSRVIKVGKYYRLYCAALVGNNGEFVFYSDDFGRNWNLLDGNDPAATSTSTSTTTTSTTIPTSPCRSGDEPKVEELPDGSVILSGRVSGGRYFNIFRYDQNTAATPYTTGSWGTCVKSTEIVAKGNSTNGEILGIQQPDNSWLYLQSVPAGPSRSHVSIYYKTISAEDAAECAYITPTSFGKGWKAYEVTELDSAYSTMCLLKTGRLGFYYERLGEDVGGYDLVFASLSLDVFNEPNIINE